MTEEAQQRVDSIQLHQQMVEVWHCGNHMHFLDNIIQIQLRLHEPGLKSPRLCVNSLTIAVIKKGEGSIKTKVFFLVLLLWIIGKLNP